MCQLGSELWNTIQLELSTTGGFADLLIVRKCIAVIDKPPIRSILQHKIPKMFQLQLLIVRNLNRFMQVVKQNKPPEDITLGFGEL